MFLRLPATPIYPPAGVGRIVAEAKSTPTVIPFWHVGELHCVGKN